MPDITSRHHPVVKAFRLLAHGGGDRLLLDGWHLVEEALNAGLAIDTIAVTPDASSAERRLVARAAAGGARVVEVSAGLLSAMSPVKSPTGVVASAHPRPASPDDALLPVPALAVCAAALQDPGNLGAVVRSAAAAGATGVIVDHASADPWGWKALRAGAGGTFHVPVARVEALSPLVDDWRRAGLRILAAAPRGGTPFHDADLRGPTALLIGGEGPGLDDALLDRADARVSIPMQGAIESLNAAVAAALLLYEARRQRRS